MCLSGYCVFYEGAVYSKGAVYYSGRSVLYWMLCALTDAVDLAYQLLVPKHQYCKLFSSGKYIDNCICSETVVKYPIHKWNINWILLYMLSYIRSVRSTSSDHFMPRSKSGPYGRIVCYHQFTKAQKHNASAFLRPSVLGRLCCFGPSLVQQCSRSIAIWIQSNLWSLLGSTLFSTQCSIQTTVAGN